MLLRYWHTLRHLQPGQIGWRLLAGLRRKLGCVRLPPLPRELQPRRLPEGLLVHDPWNRPEDLLQGRYRFLDRTRELGWPCRWEAEGEPLLWRYYLHYFNYLHLLPRTEGETLCRSWIHANPPGSAPGWDPYPLSLRIVNWCRHNPTEPEVVRSLYEQAAYLYRIQELYHPGNHLLENARALAFAAAFFKGQGESEKWGRRAMQVYRQEIPRQVLADGGHFERSPMYHALVLWGILDLVHLLPAQHPDRSFLLHTARAMTRFLRALTHPDGTLALFNDSTEEVAPSSAVLQRFASALLEPGEPPPAFPQSGYYLHRSSRIYAVIDGGPIGPDHLPAHAHADIFSYELSLEGRRVVVDTGVYEYQRSPMRDYVRSTRAHNTLTVDGQDQAECWASFRVARRFPPRHVRFTSSGSRSEFQGTFEGYARLIGDGLVHHREWSCDEAKKCLEVRDRVEGVGHHLLESRVHFHPEVQVSSEGATFRLEREGVRCRLVVKAGESSLEKGWFCPRFGTRQPRPVLVIRYHGPLPAALAYRLDW